MSDEVVNMTIEELRKRRCELQNEIEAAVRSFIEDTGIIPERVDVDVGYVETYSGERRLSGIRTTVIAKV